MRRYGVLVLAMFASVLLPASPATAVDGYTRGANVVLYDGCRNWPISYSVTLSPGTVDWSLNLAVLGPDGLETGSDYVYGAGDVASGTAEHQVCGSLQDAGPYTVEASGEWCDADYDCYPFSLPTSSFTVRRAKTKTTLTASDYTATFNQRITFRVRAKDERPNGFFPSDYAEVIFQGKVGGKWVKANRGDIFISDGRGSITYRWNLRRAVKVRVLRKADGNMAKSVSNVVTIR